MFILLSPIINIVTGNLKLLNNGLKFLLLKILMQLDFYADNVEYQSAFYGGPLMNKEELGEYLKGWQDNMENISWEAQNYLPGVDPETSLPNGSVRTYGHWSGTHSVSGKTFKGLWYHYLSFDENGKITEGGDFGDATGLVMSVMPSEE